MSDKRKVEKAHQLLTQTLQNDLRVVNIDVSAVRVVLQDARLELSEYLGMTAPRRPVDGLEPRSEFEVSAENEALNAARASATGVKPSGKKVATKSGKKIGD